MMRADELELVGDPRAAPIEAPSSAKRRTCEGHGVAEPRGTAVGCNRVEARSYQSTEPSAPSDKIVGTATTSYGDLAGSYRAKHPTTTITNVTSTSTTQHQPSKPAADAVEEKGGGIGGKGEDSKSTF